MVSKPHGGGLVNRVVAGKRLEALRSETKELRRLKLSYGLVADLENIAHGVYSPLEGFLLQEDFLYVLHDMRLSNDVAWTMPIILDVNPEEISGVKE